MDGILHGYQITDATWFYHSLLLILAVFFRFSRVWSIRNFDLVLLLIISPLVLLAKDADMSDPLLVSYTCVLSGCLIVRLLFDGLFQRRPKLEQNLNVGGLTFLCVASLAFLMTNVINQSIPQSSAETVRQGTNMVELRDATADTDPEEVEGGPASSIIAAGVSEISKTVSTNKGEQNITRLTAQLMAVLAHVAVIIGLILVGMRHFGDIQLGVAMATIYLVLPCTAYDVHRVNHVLPAAFVIWAIVSYRRPIVSGAMMGLACGTIFFTVFLAPVWVAFYGRKGGGGKFALAMTIVAAVLMSTLVRTSSDPHSLQEQLIGHIKWEGLQFVGNPDAPDSAGLSNNVRIPIFAAFIVMLSVLTIWPRKKNLEHLISHSAAIIVATQLWYPQRTGMYVLWYLPVMLLVVFRPKLNRLLPPAAVETTAADSRLPRPSVVGSQSRGVIRTGLFR